MGSGVVWLASFRDDKESGGESGVQRMERFTSVYAGYDCGASLCPPIQSRKGVRMPANATEPLRNRAHLSRYRSLGGSL